jgi:hypothetical protein
MKRAVVAITAAPSGVSAETVIATLPPLPLPSEPGGLLLAHVVIDGMMVFTPGTATTALVIRCRRSTVAGTQVGPTLTLPAAAGVAQNVAFSFDDAVVQAVPPAIPGQIYVVTLAQTSGSGAGTTNYLVVTATTS